MANRNPFSGSVRFTPTGVDRRVEYFFITGAYKSGTTWVTRMMNSHPEVFTTGELWFLGHDRCVHEWINVERFSEWASMPIVRASWMEGVPVEDMVMMAKRAMVEAMMRRHWRPGVRFLGDKTPLFYLQVPEQLHQLFPEAKLINILRDGRDVAVSHAFHMLRENNGYFYGDEEFFRRAREWHVEKRGAETPLFNGAVLRYVAGIFRETVAGARDAREVFGENYMEVRYEDLLADPYGIARVFEFLGAEASRAVVASCVEGHRFEAITGRKRGQQDASSFFRKGVSGDWKNYFSEDDVQVYMGIAGEALAETGYSTQPVSAGV